jgi:hypothetical protein
MPAADPKARPTAQNQPGGGPDSLAAKQAFKFRDTFFFASAGFELRIHKSPGNTSSRLKHRYHVAARKIAPNPVMPMAQALAAHLNPGS